MKISKRDIKLLLILAGLLIFLLLYFTMFTHYQEKSAEVHTAISELEPQLAALEEQYLNLATYEQGIEDSRTAIAEQLTHYPADIENEDFLVYLLDMEKKVGLTMDSVSFDEPGLLLEFPCDVEQDGELKRADLSAYRTGVVMTCTLNYPQLKQGIQYLYDSQQRTALDSVSLSYNAETGGLSGSFSISKYYINWDGAVYEPAIMPKTSKGVSDLFGTT